MQHLIAMFVISDVTVQPKVYSFEDVEILGINNNTVGNYTPQARKSAYKLTISFTSGSTGVSNLS